VPLVLQGHKVTKVDKVLKDHRDKKVLLEPQVLQDLKVLKVDKVRRVPQVLRVDKVLLDQQDHQVIHSQAVHLVVI
jgi:hypothetical protein